MRFLSSILFFFTALSFAQPQDPGTFLGYELGSEFTRHADVVRYFNYLDQNSDLLTYNVYGKTYERRTLGYAVLTAAENQAKLEEIRKNHLHALGVTQENGSAEELPIIWLSYNVHGNEASSTEAAMKTAYTLLTSRQDLLKNAIVIIDPAINPDGRDRYVNWYNRVRTLPNTVNADADEHNEPWPGGRYTHYLFDPNRDWFWTTQEVSKARIKVYNKWLPHVHVDFHEMGVNSGYFFAPGAEPYHTIFTDWQKEFQGEVGKHNAEIFDQNGWLFFTREIYDFLYPSYGDTYPTYFGAIGMTYEQAGGGAAGLGIGLKNGEELTLKDRMEHHFASGIATIETSERLGDRLIREMHNYFKDQSGLTYKDFVIQGDQGNKELLAALLDRHGIQYYYASGGNATGFRYSTQENGTIDATDALVVPTHQPKGKMVHVLFEPDTKLSTPLTYDITAWSLIYAYDLDGVASKRELSLAKRQAESFEPNTVQQGAAGYLVKWESMKDARFLADLLKAKLKVRFSEKKLRFSDTDFEPGTLVITRGDNKSNPDFEQTLVKIANTHKRKLYSSTSSFSTTQYDFGSTQLKIIDREKVAVLMGEGTNAMSYGFVWNFFEQQLKYPMLPLNTRILDRVDLSQFDVIILPEIRDAEVLNSDRLHKLKAWVEAGGKLISMSTTAKLLADNGFGLKTQKTVDPEEGKEADGDEVAIKTPVRYDQRERENATNLVTGSIFEVEMDNSHPMAFGYGDQYFSLKLGSNAYKYLEGRNATVGYLPEEPNNVAGFAGEDAKKKLGNSLVFGEAKLGKGSVLYYIDDVLFRNFWEGGKLMMVNGVFFVNK